MWGDRPGVQGADLVDPAPVQLGRLPAHEQIRAVRVTLPVSYRKVFPNRVDHLIPQVDDPLLPALSLSNGKLPTGEIDIRQQLGFDGIGRAPKGFQRAPVFFHVLFLQLAFFYP